MREKSISLFFPVYNDAATIGRMVNDAISVLESLVNDYEVIIVNDGSTDDTQQIINQLVKKNNRIKVIQHFTNRGYGAALRTGFTNATKELIFYTDSDGQYDVKEFPLLFSSMDDGVDVVNGYKIKRQDSIQRIIMGRVYYWLIRLAFNLKLRDITCDFRLIKRSVMDEIKLNSNSGAICVEMLKKIQDSGYKILEVPVHHYPRMHNRSQFFTFTNLFKMTLELTKFCWREVFKNK